MAAFLAHMATCGFSNDSGFLLPCCAATVGNFQKVWQQQFREAGANMQACTLPN
jgi:hypothetical protein